MDWSLAVSALAVVVPTLAVGLTAWIAHRARLADRAENRDAHAGIVERIEGVDQRSQQRDDALARSLDGHRTALEAVARDVAFMAGRQAERDQGKT